MLNDKTDCHICGESSQVCEICGEPCSWISNRKCFCEEHYKEYKRELKRHEIMEMTTPTSDDLQTLAECALRYALYRQTYITFAVSRAIMAISPDALSVRSISAMLTDLDKYMEKRSEYTRAGKKLDDDCDYESWQELQTYLRSLLAKKGERV